MPLLEYLEWWVEVDGAPVAASMLEWAEWSAAAKKLDASRVALSSVRGYDISAIFVGGTRNWPGRGLYEVAIRAPDGEYVWFCQPHTRNEAQAVHDRIVALIDAGAVNFDGLDDRAEVVA